MDQNQTLCSGWFLESNSNLVSFIMINFSHNLWQSFEFLFDLVIFVWLCVFCGGYLGATPGSPQGLLLTLCLGITPGSTERTFGVLGFDLRLVICRARALATVLALWLLICTCTWYIFFMLVKGHEPLGIVVSDVLVLVGPKMYSQW